MDKAGISEVNTKLDLGIDKYLPLKEGAKSNGDEFNCAPVLSEINQVQPLAQMKKFTEYLLKAQDDNFNITMTVNKIDDDSVQYQKAGLYASRYDTTRPDLTISTSHFSSENNWKKVNDEIVPATETFAKACKWMESRGIVVSKPSSL